jgi:hypothetical protein
MIAGRILASETLATLVANQGVSLTGLKLVNLGLGLVLIIIFGSLGCVGGLDIL